MWKPYESITCFTWRDEKDKTKISTSKFFTGTEKKKILKMEYSWSCADDNIDFIHLCSISRYWRIGFWQHIKSFKCSVWLSYKKWIMFQAFYSDMLQKGLPKSTKKRIMNFRFDVFVNSLKVNKSFETIA